jgi:hypothetical protein
MAILLTDQAKNSERAEDRATSADRISARAQWLWTLFGVALLAIFVAFVVDDFGFRTLIAVQ